MYRVSQPEFPESQENSNVHERLAGASERRDGGVLLQRAKKEKIIKGLRKHIV